MSLAVGEIKVERTGFKKHDRLPPFVARVYLEASFDGLRFAYGATAGEAEQKLMRAIDVVAEVEVSK